MEYHQLDSCVLVGTLDNPPLFQDEYDLTMFLLDMDFRHLQIDQLDNITQHRIHFLL